MAERVLRITGRLVDTATSNLAYVALYPFLSPQQTGDEPRRRREELNPWSILPVMLLSSGVGLAMVGMLLIMIPQMVAILFPSTAGSEALMQTAWAMAGGGFTIPLGDMADREKSFYGPIVISYLTLAGCFGAYYGLMVFYAGGDAGTAKDLDTVGRLILRTLLTITTFIAGWATTGLGNTQQGMISVYGMVDRSKLGRFTAVGAIGVMLDSTVLMSVLASFPLLPGNYSILLILVATNLTGLFLMLLVIPRSILEPYQLLPKPGVAWSWLYYTGLLPSALVEDEEQHFSLKSFVETARDFRTRPYRPLALLIVGVSSGMMVMVVLSPVAIYLLEDLTPLGEEQGKAAEVNAYVMAASSLFNAVITIPLGHCIDRVRRPVLIFAWIFVPSAIASSTLLLAKIEMVYAIPSLFAIIFIPTINALFTLPAINACIVNPYTIARDVNFIFGVSALVPIPLSIFVAPVLSYFGESEYKGRERPQYTFLGYSIIVGICVVFNLAGAVAGCIAASIVRESRDKEAKGSGLL